MAARLREEGMTVTISAARRDPSTLHDAVREAELLIELTQTPGVHLAGQDETYRLLIGVLLREIQTSSASSGRAPSPRWPTMTTATTPSCWPRCRPSWPTTAPPPRPPRR